MFWFCLVLVSVFVSFVLAEANLNPVLMLLCKSENSKHFHFTVHF